MNRTTPAPQHKLMSILLIEPNKTLGKTYKSALARDGHDVILCHNAQEAILAADRLRPDVVVLELQLAGHSGAEFLYEFRSYPEWWDVPVILHTMVPVHLLVAEEQFGRLGIAAHLYKPATQLWRLVRTVNETLPAAV